MAFTLEQLKEKLNNPNVQNNPVAKKLIEKQIAELEASKKPAEKPAEKAEKTDEPATEKKKRGRKPKVKEETPSEKKLDKEEIAKIKEKIVAKKKEKAPKKEYEPRKRTTSDEEPDCDTLIEQFRARRRKAKENAKKRKTKPVFRKISSNIVDAVEKAIKNVPKEKLKKSPKEVIKNFGELRKSAESFLLKFKEVLGSDFNKGQMESELKELQTLIDKMIKKYNSKSVTKAGM